MKRMTLLGFGCCMLVAVATSQAQETVLLSDTYDTTASNFINSDLESRQAGIYATSTYTNSESGLTDASHTVGFGGAALRLSVTPSPPYSNRWVSVTPDRNFDDDPGDGYSFIRFDIKPGAGGWLGLVFASPTAIASDGDFAKGGVSVLFRSNGNHHVWINNVDKYTGDQNYGTAGVTNTVEFRIYDPAGGSPWDDSGVSRVEMYVNGAETPKKTFNVASPGFSDNYITLAGWQDSGSPNHDVEDLVIGTAEFPGIPEPSTLPLLGLALVGTVLVLGRRLLRPAATSAR
ncbi:PEP-CTERM sorting domain-containing protein [Planctomycetota bacterium]